VEGGHGVDDRGGEKDLTADDADGRGYKGGISLEGEFPPITCRRCEELLWRAIHNARHPRNAPLWVQVKSALGFGSNRARWACRQFGLDPEQVTAFDDEGEESAATSNFRGWLWDRVNRIGEPVVIEHAADCPKDDTCVCSGMRFLNAFLAEDESPF